MSDFAYFDALFECPDYFRMFIFVHCPLLNSLRRICPIVLSPSGRASPVQNMRRPSDLCHLYAMSPLVVLRTLRGQVDRVPRVQAVCAQSDRAYPLVSRLS